MSQRRTCQREEHVKENMSNEGIVNEELNQREGTYIEKRHQSEGTVKEKISERRHCQEEHYLRE